MTETILTLSVRLPDGMAIPIARINNPSLARRCGKQAVLEAENRARALRRADPVLGRLGSAEARRLGRAMQELFREAS